MRTQSFLVFFAFLVVVRVTGADVPLPIVADGQTYHPATEVEAGELRRLITLIKESPDLVNRPSPSGRTPLLDVVENGQGAATEFLLAHGANVTMRDAKGLTALHLASAHGIRGIVERLLAHGAEVNARDNGGATPLFFAVNRNLFETARALLAKGADPDAIGKFQEFKSGVSPLFLAAVRGSLEMVRLLLDYKANPNLKTFYGDTPLGAALPPANWEPLASLLIERGADVNAADNLGATVLCRSMGLKHEVAVVKFLLQHGANPNLRNKGGYAALGSALGFGSVETIRLLLEAGAQANVAFGDGPPLLTRAVEWRKLEEARLLLEHQADPNMTDRDGRTTLFKAVANQDLGMVKLLLAHGARARVSDHTGTTLLQTLEREPAEVIYSHSKTNYSMEAMSPGGHFSPERLQGAAQNGDRVVTSDIHYAIFSLLVDQGADVNAKDSSGKTVLCSVVESRSPVMTQFLLEHHANPNVVYRGMARTSPASGAEQTADATTPLATAVKCLDLHLVRLLLEHGADPNAAVTLDGQGRWTPLAIATDPDTRASLREDPSRSDRDVELEDALAVARLLLEYKADVNVKIATGPNRAMELPRSSGTWEPLLMLAVEHEQTDMAKLLLQHRADANATDNRGRTLLHRAAGDANIGSHEDLLALLLGNQAAVDARDNDGRTPLLVAVQAPQPDMISLLLDHGADINARDDHEHTALFWAVLTADSRMVRLLLEHGADVNIAAPVDGWAPCSLLQLAEAMAAGVVARQYDHGQLIERMEPRAAAAIVHLLRQHDAWPGPVATFAGEVRHTLLPLAAANHPTLGEALKKVEVTPSADLKHVRLTRYDPTTRSRQTQIVNLVARGLGRRAKNLLLREGDSVLVPTKAGPHNAASGHGPPARTNTQAKPPAR